jgi:hypothetical protein
MRSGAFGSPSFELGKLFAFGCFLLSKTTLFVLVAAAARAWIIASGFRPSWSTMSREGCIQCIQPCWLTPHSIICFLPLIRISPTRLDRNHAHYPQACCILVGIAARPGSKVQSDGLPGVSRKAVHRQVQTPPSFEAATLSLA